MINTVVIPKLTKMWKGQLQSHNRVHNMMTLPELKFQKASEKRKMNPKMVMDNMRKSQWMSTKMR